MPTYPVAIHTNQTASIVDWLFVENANLLMIQG